jgi:hypothetical protein
MAGKIGSYAAPQRVKVSPPQTATIVLPRLARKDKLASVAGGPYFALPASRASAGHGCSHKQKNNVSRPHRNRRNSSLDIEIEPRITSQPPRNEPAALTDMILAMFIICNTLFLYDDTLWPVMLALNPHILSCLI